jgi:hypothetical protein
MNTNFISKEKTQTEGSVCVFWDVTPYGLGFNIEVSQEHGASIFKVEIYKLRNWFSYIGRLPERQSRRRKGVRSSTLSNGTGGWENGPSSEKHYFETVNQFFIVQNSTLKLEEVSSFEISVQPIESRDSAVYIPIGYGLDELGGRSSSPSGGKNFLFFMSSRPVLGLTQPLIQWVPGALSLRVKRQGREADHSQLVPRSRKCGSINPLPHTSSWRSP